MANGTPRKNDTPRTKEKEVRTAEIEQAARKIFLSRGFQAATIQEIAEEAGIAKGTVYLYYKSKDDLYTALLLPSLEFLNEKFGALLAEVESEKFESGEELVDALGEMFIELQARDPEMVLIYQGFQVGTFITSVSKETRERLNGFARRNFQAFRAIFEKGIELGLLRDLDVRKAVDAIWGLLLGVAQVEWNKLQDSGKDHFRETLRYALAMMYGGICAT
ncbi:MAG TPA: TetR/AcrR family transcriptional regulator, partial [Candidatus Eisenbacteria bacterium]